MMISTEGQFTLNRGESRKQIPTTNRQEFLVRLFGKSNPIILVLGLGLLTFTPNEAVAVQVGGECYSKYVDCMHNGQEVCERSVNISYEDCMGAWGVGCLAGLSGCYVWAGIQAAYNWVTGCYIVPSISVATNDVINSTRVWGVGAYYLTTNRLGIIQPLQISAGPWNGTNFVPALTVTNVEFFTIPHQLLATYAPSNYSRAPWFEVGKATRNANGLWELSWTPTNYTAHVIVANVYDSKFGVIDSVALAIPQLTRPYICSPTLSAGQLSFTIMGPMASTTTIQFSSNLTHHAWTDVLTVSNLAGQVEVRGVSSANRIGFYRARLD